MACVFEPQDQQGTAHPTQEQEFLTGNVGLAGVIVTSWVLLHETLFVSRSAAGCSLQQKSGGRFIHTPLPNRLLPVCARCTLCLCLSFRGDRSQ